MVKLLQLFVDVRGGRGIADVGVDLALERDANAHGLERFMVNVRGNDGAATSDFAAHQFRLDLLAPRDEGHLLRDHTLPRVVHLRNIAPRAVAWRKRSIPRRRLRQSLLKPSVSNSHA